MKKITRCAVAAVLGAGLLLCTAACSPAADDDVATGSVDVDTQVVGQLEAAGIAADPGSVNCAQELVAKAGESVRCDFSSDGQPVGLVASVVRVEGADVDVKVKTQARPIPKDVLGYEVGRRVGQQLDLAVNTTCDGELAAEVGASTGCVLSASGETREVEVTVASVDGGLVGYEITD